MKTRILDSYTSARPELMRYGGLPDNTDTDFGIVKLFEELCEKYNTTLIVIGHTHNFTTKTTIFDDNIQLARLCTEELSLERVERKAKSATAVKPAVPAKIDYILHVYKGTGKGGPAMIDNWMRDEAMSISMYKKLEKKKRVAIR